MENERELSNEDLAKIADYLGLDIISYQEGESMGEPEFEEDFNWREIANITTLEENNIFLDKVLGPIKN